MHVRARARRDQAGRERDGRGSNGETRGVAVLAGDGVVDIGRSAIVGDGGTYPRPAVSNHLDLEVTGSVHRASPAVVQAQLDLDANTPRRDCPTGGRRSQPGGQR